MRFFDQHPKFYETTGTALIPNRLNQRYNAIIEQHREYIADAHVLDLASHDGRWSFAALKTGAAHVTGVEARPELVRKSLQTFKYYEMNRSSYNFYRGDAISFLRDSNESFDVVLCLGFYYHTLHHIDIFESAFKLGAQHIILDTAVSLNSSPVIDLALEEVGDVRNSIDYAGSGVAKAPVGIPSRSAIQIMAEYVGYTVTEIAWHEICHDWAECDDYRQDLRSTFLCRKT